MPLEPVTQEHIEYLIENIKDDHVRELNWFGLSPRHGILSSLENCLGMLSATKNNQLLFIAGVMDRSLFGDASTIFYISTKHYDDHKRHALRLTRELFEKECWKYSRYKKIEQYLPPPYTTGIRFLEWLGWKRGGVFSYGSKQAQHMYYERIN